MRFTTRLASCALMGTVVTLALAGSANAEFQNQAAAAAAGDPAATAPVISMPKTATVDGKSISIDQAASQGLSCDQAGDGAITCRSKAATAAMRAAARARPRSVTGVATIDCDDPRLRVYQYSQAAAPPCAYTGNGWELSLTSRQSWYDLTGSYDNEVSGYYMGNHSGHLSENWGGGGNWCPCSTGVNDYTQNLNPTSWTDRISSRYRN